MNPMAPIDPTLPLVLAPVAVQTAAMLVDELVFHRRRGLPRWERVGHVLDTLTVLGCFVYALLVAPHGRAAIGGYLALAGFSTLFVTKDEAVHTRHCGPGEHWLHSVLFVLHPIVLGAVGLTWLAAHGAGPLAGLVAPSHAHLALVGQTIATGAFGLYQLAYWNFPWARRQPLAATTPTTPTSLAPTTSLTSEPR
ncbi:MAG: hypothetical protein NVSMB47_22520 [Polyangiales bacterium]